MHTVYNTDGICNLGRQSPSQKHGIGMKSVTFPDSHPVEPRGFSEKVPRVKLSKERPRQTRGQSQVIKENITKSLGSMGLETGYSTERGLESSDSVPCFRLSIGSHINYFLLESLESRKYEMIHPVL